MQLYEWYKAKGGVVISVNGRGKAVIVPLPRGDFRLQLERHAGAEAGFRKLDNAEATLDSEADVLEVVDCFLECFGRSEEDKAEMLAIWQVEQRGAT